MEIGDWVRHKDFGVGKVISDNTGADAYNVKFEQGQEKGKTIWCWRENLTKFDPEDDTGKVLAGHGEIPPDMFSQGVAEDLKAEKAEPLVRDLPSMFYVPAELRPEDIKVDPRVSILDEARQLVTTDRNATHGEPEDNFANIAMFWSDWLYMRGWRQHGDVAKIEAFDVAEMMSLFKKARKAHNPTHRDNHADDLGYCSCSWRVVQPKE